ncbi:MAG: hypothetical protein COX42_01425 [Parcubacteria group bacterium CG23_combo_of_CG06-09_8_20_14_all_35_6]|nr:MAG: hypothetical protein COX42_01425 [Parcubacteria group bacterium CG23_combo_of_CG06-09_8_20_14_all_35_6]
MGSGQKQGVKMNASVILAIVAILATAVIVTAVVFNRLATYKRGYEFFKERNSKKAIQAAKVLNRLVINHKTHLDYLLHRAEKRDEARADLEIFTALVQLAMDQLDDGHEQKVVIVLQSTIKVLEQKLGVTAPYVPMKLG